MEFFLGTVAKRLKELRTKRGLSLRDIANELGLSDSIYSKWEKGKAIPSAQNIFKLAYFFGVTSDYLIGLKDESGMASGDIRAKAKPCQGGIDFP